MAKRSTLLFCVALTLVGIWQLSRTLDGPDDTQFLVNRVWLERMPRDERDMFLQAALIRTRSGETGGAAGATSSYRIFIELFDWKLDGNKLAMTFPQDRKKLTATVRTWRCKDAPKPFDLCLELRAGRERIRLFSSDDFVIDPRTGKAGHAPVDLPAVHAMPATECDGCTEGFPPWLLDRQP